MPTKEYKKCLGIWGTGDTSMTDSQKTFDYIKHGFTPEQVLIRVKPQHKKSVDLVYELYDKTVNDPDQRFVTISETYRWGEGYLSGDMLDYPDTFDQKMLSLDPTIGHGNELDDLCSINFDYDGAWDDQQKSEFEDKWYNGDNDDDDGRSGASWLYDFQDQWQVETETLYIHGPYRFDIVDKDEYNKIYLENYQIKTKEADNG